MKKNSTELDKKKRTGPHHPYDTALKRIFAHPRIVIELMKGFIPEEWVKDLDFSNMKLEPTEHITNYLQSRRDDIIWNIPFKSNKPPLFVFIILEFQMQNFKFMANRFMIYIGLILETLIKTKESITVGELPAILPMVLYYGKPPWTDPLNTQDCFSPHIPDELKRFIPKFEYYLIDICRLNLEEYNLEDSKVISEL